MLTRRHFIVSLGASAAACALPGVVSPAVRAAETPHPLAAPTPGLPTAQLLGQGAAAIVWQVRGLCTGFVEYGPTEALGSVAHGAENGLNPLADDVLRVTLRDLAPGTKVFYRTVTAPVTFPHHYAIRRGEGIASPVHAFTMPDAGAKEARLAVWNDVHSQTKTLATLREATEKFAPGALLLNGDLVQSEYNQATDLADTFLGETRGVATPRWPTLLARGNHDVRGLAARDLPRFAPPQSVTGYHGLLRLGPLAVLWLDTGEDKEGPDIYGGLTDFAGYYQAQAAWLEQAVADARFATAPFRLLCCHIPLRWKEADDPAKVPTQGARTCLHGDALWSPILAKGKVQAVLSGHTHQFWHDAPTAARPFHQIVGGGPETASTAWSPTPATLTEITAGAKLRIRVAEAASGKEHLDLELDPVV